MKRPLIQYFGIGLMVPVAAIIALCAAPWIVIGMLTCKLYPSFGDEIVGKMPEIKGPRATQHGRKAD